MKKIINLMDILACPYCNQGVEHSSEGVEHSSEGVHCPSCIISFPFTDDNIFDLRLKSPKKVTVTHKLNGNVNAVPPYSFYSGFLKKKQTECIFDPAELPTHISPEMASYYPPSKSKKAICLDLGCGNGEYRHFIEKLGYAWCGVDYSRVGAPVFADAHALPFQSDTFELISSLAVLEHLQFPDVALREAFRVLQPGGTFIGSVTYLVPFHDTASYYNMTHSGLINSLLDAGFDISIVGGEKNYLGIQALAYSGMFLDLKRKITYALVSPLVVLQKLWWRFKRRKQHNKFTIENECTLTTGAFIFVATKPVS